MTDSVNVPFREIVEIIKDYELDAVGIMHTDVNIVSDSIKIVREIYDGTILVYPDSGGWVSPNWIFDKVIKPHELMRFYDFVKNPVWRYPSTRIWIN